MSVCFDLSGFTGLTLSDQLKYRTYWDTFTRIQIYNSNVSTLRHQDPDQNIIYYVYKSYQESSDFTQGRILHIRRYPNSNWDLVPKD